MRLREEHHAGRDTYQKRCCWVVGFTALIKHVDSVMMDESLSLVWLCAQALPECV